MKKKADLCEHDVKVCCVLRARAPQKHANIVPLCSDGGAPRAPRIVVASSTRGVRLHKFAAWLLIIIKTWNYQLISWRAALSVSALVPAARPRPPSSRYTYPRPRVRRTCVSCPLRNGRRRGCWAAGGSGWRGWSGEIQITFSYSVCECRVQLRAEKPFADNTLDRTRAAVVVPTVITSTCTPSAPSPIPRPPHPNRPPPPFAGSDRRVCPRVCFIIVAATSQNTYILHKYARNISPRLRPVPTTGGQRGWFCENITKSFTPGACFASDEFKMSLWSCSFLCPSRRQ